MKSLTFIAALAVLAAPGAALAQSPPCQGDDQAFAVKAEALIVAGLEAERARLAPGAPPLRPDPVLGAIARARSCAMARGFAPFSHIDDQGRFIAGDMVEARFGPYGAIGENIMEMGRPMALLGVRPFGAEEFARAAVTSWMQSAEHRANILDPDFDLSGIGVAKADGEAVATEVFHGPPHHKSRKPANAPGAGWR